MGKNFGNGKYDEIWKSQPNSQPIFLHIPCKKVTQKMMPGFYSSKIDKMKGLYLEKENLREPNVKWLVFRKVSRHQNCWNFGWPVMAVKMTAFCHFMRWNGAF